MAPTSPSADVRTFREAPVDAPSPAAPAATPQEEGEGGDETDAPVEKVDLEKMVGLWPAVVDQVRQSGSELLSHVLSAARPVALDVEQAVLEVGFPPSAAFNKRKAEASEARERFSDAVRTIVGERLRPVYVLLDREEEPAAAVRMSDEEALALARREFDAEYVDEDEPAAAGSDAKERGGP